MTDYSDNIFFLEDTHENLLSTIEALSVEISDLKKENRVLKNAMQAACVKLEKDNTNMRKELDKNIFKPNFKNPRWFKKE